LRSIRIIDVDGDAVRIGHGDEAGLEHDPVGDRGAAHKFQGVVDIMIRGDDRVFIIGKGRRIVGRRGGIPHLIGGLIGQNITRIDPEIDHREQSVFGQGVEIQIRGIRRNAALQDDRQNRHQIRVIIILTVGDR